MGGHCSFFGCSSNCRYPNSKQNMGYGTFWTALTNHTKSEFMRFSLTWSASMQIYLNKRKPLHNKRVQLPEDWFRTPIWPPWRHVKTLYKTGTSDQINTVSECAVRYRTRKPCSRLGGMFIAVGPQACRLCFVLVLMGEAQTVLRVRRRSSILGCSYLRRIHFRSSQQGGRPICWPQGDEGVGCGNELSMVGQSREGGLWEGREVPTTATWWYSWTSSCTFWGVV